MDTPDAQHEWSSLPSEPASALLNPDELRAALADASKLWLAHDGLWFLEWEKRHGMDEAIDADEYMRRLTGHSL